MTFDLHKIITIINLYHGYFWPRLVTIAHRLPHLTSDDLWPIWRSSSRYFHQGIFWQGLVAIAHSLLHLTLMTFDLHQGYHHDKRLSESGPGILKCWQHLIPICPCNGLFTVLPQYTWYYTKYMGKNCKQNTWQIPPRKHSRQIYWRSFSIK